MRTFEKGNWDSGDACVICGQQGEGEIVLIPKSGTEIGNNVEAVQVYTACLTAGLWYYPDHNVIMATTDL